MKRQGSEEEDWQTFDVLRCDEYLLHWVKQPHMSEVWTGKRKDKVVIDHLLMIFLSLRHKLILDHIVEKRFVQIAKNQMQARRTNLTEHPKLQANHVSE